MNSNLTKQTTVGSLVAEDFNRAQLFERLGIDYCCHGSDTLEVACKKAYLNSDDVLTMLENKNEVASASLDFSSWPLDLLVDYVLKKHHRNFHLYRDALMQLVNKVASVHGNRHPELLDIRNEVAASFEELEAHFAKEENILFPRLYEIYNAHEEGRAAAPFHCGTIEAPVRQMMIEHDDAGETWARIAKLTNNFTTPTDGCNSYRLMNQQLKQFLLDLKEHISLENNLIFQGFLRMEQLR